MRKDNPWVSAATGSDSKVYVYARSNGQFSESERIAVRSALVKPALELSTSGGTLAVGLGIANDGGGVRLRSGYGCLQTS